MQRIMIDIGLLALRVGLGVTFAIAHGWGKITGGPDKWQQVGGAMSTFGIDFSPTFWGFMAAFAEFVGAGLIVFGLFTRIGAFLLLSTMIVATAVHATGTIEEGMTAMQHFQMKTSRPLELAFVFLGLLIAGPGRLSIDQIIFGRKKKLGDN
jgi:putative oxidoreductase